MAHLHGIGIMSSIICLCVSAFGPTCKRPSAVNKQMAEKVASDSVVIHAQGIESQEKQIIDTASTDSTAFQMIGIDDCGFVRVFAHPHPDSLVYEFLSRDASGQFLRTDEWFAGAIDCPNIEGGPDTFTLISGYSVAPLQRHENEANFLVKSERLGFVDPFEFEEDRKTVVDTIVVHRTSYGWRIKSPALRLHVLVDSVFENSILPKSAIDRIQKTIGR